MYKQVFEQTSKFMTKYFINRPTLITAKLHLSNTTAKDLQRIRVRVFLNYKRSPEHFVHIKPTYPAVAVWIGGFASANKTDKFLFDSRRKLPSATGPAGCVCVLNKRVFVPGKIK